jgi:hypothetical protein
MGRTPAFPGGTHRVSPVGPSMGFAALSAHPQLAHPGRVRRRNDSVSFLRNFGRAGEPVSAPTLRSGKLDRPVKSRFFRRSNFLAIRGKGVPLLLAFRPLGIQPNDAEGPPQSRSRPF